MPSKDKDRIARIEDAIVATQDFPRKGVTFRDTLPLFEDTVLLMDTISVLAEHVSDKFGSVDVIVGLEAKGFLFAPLIAVQLGCKFVPIRKLGKLPGKCVQHSYTASGSENVIEIQDGAIREGQTVIIVDDLILSGEYAAASGDIVRKMGGNLLETLFLCEIGDLQGAQKVKGSFHSIIKY